MDPYAHFLVGIFIAYLFGQRKLLNLLSFGFIAVLPDFDALMRIVFPTIIHRGITHTLYFSIISGLISLVLFKQFVIGLTVHLSHLLLDVLQGGICLLPSILCLDWTITENQVLISAIVGTTVLITLIMLEYFKTRKQEDIQIW